MASKFASGLSSRFTKRARESESSSAANHRRVVVGWAPSAPTTKSAVSQAAIAA